LGLNIDLHLNLYLLLDQGHPAPGQQGLPNLVTRTYDCSHSWSGIKAYDLAVNLWLDLSDSWDTAKGLLGRCLRSMIGLITIYYDITRG